MLKKNQEIKKNEKILTIEAGKVSLDINSPYNGIINEIKVEIGNVIDTTTILFEISTTKNNINKKEKSIKKYTNLKKRSIKELSINLNNIKTINKKDSILKKTIEIPISSKKKISNEIIKKSWEKIPHVTQFAELEITNLMEVYNKKKKELKNQKIVLTLLPFIIKSITLALIKYPNFNASLYDEDKITLKKYYNIGIVMTTESGLIIPIIKNSDKKTILEINKELISKRKNINENNLKPKELDDGTFTISNLGNYTNGYFTPIIKYPESSILGISKCQNKILSESNKNILSKPILPISLSYDHRIIDGIDAANFINYFHNNLNNIAHIENE